jgi:hypothetical protein
VIVSRLLLLTACGCALLHALPKDNEQRKSLVLKDRAPERNLFHFDPDNSRREMWNEFMLVKDANAGDPLAQHELGLRYLMGKGFPADTEKAAYWIIKAADQNLMAARYNLAILENNGMAVPWNPFEAYKHFKFCAEHGMMEAQYVYGLLLTDNLTVSRNYGEAYRWMKSSADSGYAPAQELLVEFKHRGFERLQDTSARHPRDTSSAVAHSAAAQKPSSAPRPVILDMAGNGDPDSVPTPSQKELLQEALLDANAKLKDHLLNLSIDSTGERPDTASWRGVLHSAEAGNPEALTLVGYRYATGDHVRKSAIAAAAYYLRAIRYESSSASILLWRLAQTENFYATLKKSVDAGSAAAEFCWAGLTLFGFDRQLTEGQAIDLMAKAAHANFTPAMVELGIRYFTGASVPQDRNRAKELFDHAARLGSREALLRSSMIKLNSTKGATPDKALLVVLAQSAEDGSVLAEEMLGYFYSTGTGVPRNIPESVKYYRKAAQRGSTIAYNALRSLYDELRPSEAVFRMED